MSEDKTIKERVSELEAKYDIMMKIVVDNTTNISNSLEDVNKKMNEVSPIIKEIITVKGVGSITWKILRYTGTIVLACIASWHLFKDGIKHFIHYIFN